MLILNGISFFFEDSVNVYNTKTGVTSEACLPSLVNRIENYDDTIYGLRLFKPNAMYPLDSRYLPQFGAVIVPSEAQEAMKKYKKEK